VGRGGNTVRLRPLPITKELVIIKQVSKEKEMPVITEAAANPTEQARGALRELLTERPEFIDTKRNNIRDLIPFLEEEDGFPIWLGHFEGNLRNLTTIWAQVAKQLQENPPIQEVINVVPEIVSPIPEKKVTRKTTPTAKAKPLVEENRQIVVVQEQVPAVLEEQVIQAGRALAEQFAIVKHHEMALQQAARTIEEANEALALARQTYANSTTAYSNALEDLARLMANSLGTKATDFSKLMAKVSTATKA